LADVAAGELRAAGLEVMIGGLERVRQVDRRIDGVLGHNFLRGRRYLIDVTERRMVVGAASISGERLPVRWSDGRVSVRLHIDDRPEWLVLDSGAPALVLFRAGASPGQAIRVLTANGSIAASAKDVMVRLGSGIARRLDAVVVDGNREGLLPVSRFHAVYVDPAAGFAVFDH
jgi:hypothetical protein